MFRFCLFQPGLPCKAVYHVRYKLIRNEDLRLVTPSGFVTPGSYLAFLEQEYQQQDSIDISRTVYRS